MGKKCIDIGCPYFADDGTCLLPEYDLKDKCAAMEVAEIEEKEEPSYGDSIRERLKALGTIE